MLQLRLRIYSWMAAIVVWQQRSAIWLPLQGGSNCTQQSRYMLVVGKDALKALSECYKYCDLTGS